MPGLCFVRMREVFRFDDHFHLIKKSGNKKTWCKNIMVTAFLSSDKTLSIVNDCFCILGNGGRGHVSDIEGELV